MRRKYFTIIELLVVVAIITILAAMLLPALNKARGTAQKSSCISNLKQIGLAVAMYMDSSNGYYPVAVRDLSSSQFHGWDRLIYSYIARSAVLPEGRFQPENALNTYFCPGAKSPRLSPTGGYSLQSYAMPHITTYNRDAIGVIIDSSGVPNYGSTSSYRYQFFRKDSNVAKPSSTILLTEVDAVNDNQAQGNGRRIAMPERQVKIDSDGFNASVTGLTNHTRNLHGDSYRVNYLFAAGNVDNHRYDDPFILGPGGTVTNPRGAWTIDPND